MAGGIGQNFGAGMGPQQQPSWAPEQQASQPTVSPDRGAVQDAGKMAQTAAASEGASTEVQLIERPKTRQLSGEDLNKALIQLGLQPSSENKELAMLMMQYGMELSSDNFDELFKLMRGNHKKGVMESAVIAQSKGAPSKEVVSSLQEMLFQNNHISKQTQQFQQALSSFQNKLEGFKTLNPSLMGGLASIMTDLSDELKKLMKQSQSGKDLLSQFRRGGLIKDLFSLHQLMKGIEGKFASDPAMQSFLKSVPEFKKGIHDYLSGMMAQSVISKTSEQQLSGVMENFAFWQIPNMLVEDPSKAKIDILIKKEAMKKNTVINPEKTKMIVNLETPEMGALSMIMVVLDQKVWYTFNAEKESTVKHISSLQLDLKERMEGLNYQMVGFQATKKKVDVKKYMLPTMDLDTVLRIDAEV